MTKFLHPSFIIAIIIMLSINVKAQEDGKIIPKKIYTTLHSATPPTIDGKISEAVWDAVEWEGDFTQWQPDEGEKPSQKTRFKILYDDKNLYVAARCYDTEPDKIVSRMSRRDGFQGDFVEINIDSYHDLLTAFSFTITVAGVKGDEAVTKNGNNWDTSWNPIWYAKTNIDDEGWTAEMKIPFTQLRFSEKEEQIWGIQIVRRDFRLAERSIWQRIPRELAGWVSNFGELHGLKNIKPQKQIEIQPYVSGQLETFEAEEGNPFATGSRGKFDAGVDGKIGIGNNMTLDFTINPDFGQVEADPSAISLDGFEIFFQEQRPFFVENKNIFDYQFGNNMDNVFYSRRIGRAPQGYPDTEDHEFVKMPINTTILGAAKFSGKTKDGWSIGLLESVTGNMYAEIDNNGERREEIVEPLTNYIVTRAQKDFNNSNSYIGGIFTATNRNLNGNFSELRKAAYTGGIDFRHSWKEQMYYVEGNVIASRVEGSKEAITKTQKSIEHLFQRVDAKNVSVDPNRTSLTGTGGKFEGGKSGGGKWRYNAGVEWRSPELELNDVGYMRQADDIRQFADVRYQLLKPTKLYRAMVFGVRQNSTYDFDGNYNRIEYQGFAESNWKNNWFTEFAIAHKPVIFINTFLRGGPRMRFSEENYWYMFIGTDRRKKFHTTVGYIDSDAKQNQFGLKRYVLRFGYQPIDALSLSLNTEYQIEPNRTQYVPTNDFDTSNRYILGNIDQRTWQASLRLNYNINPNLTIQYYGQPFISRGEYTNFNFVNNPTAENLYDRVTWYQPDQISNDETDYFIDENVDGITDYSFGDPDFSFVQFRSNLVVRWEYIPGSEVYFVWSQGITEFGAPTDTLFNQINHDIFGQRPTNTFLIKATYRFML